MTTPDDLRSLLQRYVDMDRDDFDSPTGGLGMRRTALHHEAVAALAKPSSAGEALTDLAIDDLLVQFGIYETPTEEQVAAFADALRALAQTVQPAPEPAITERELAFALNYHSDDTRIDDADWKIAARYFEVIQRNRGTHPSLAAGSPPAEQAGDVEALRSALAGLLQIEDARIGTGAFKPNAEAAQRIEAARAALAQTGVKP